MLQDELLLHTKLSLPRLHRRVLHRAALIAQLREALDYRLTLVQAGTGYGKSTTLAALAESVDPLCWYSVDEADADPQRFLSYLITAFRTRLPTLSDSPLAALQELSSNGNSNWSRALDALVNALATALTQPSLLVIDDFHFVAHAPEVNALAERFISYMPPQLHVIISSRHVLAMPMLVTWRAKGELLEIDRTALAFQPSEVEALFREAYGMHLSSETVAMLTNKTEGWPIALQLVWQGVRHDATQSVADLLRPGPKSLGALFDYLARDVLDRQPPELANFLRETAVLRELTPEACNAVTRLADGAAMLERLHHLDLFVIALGQQQYGYHYLFHDFLREQLNAEPERARERHGRAAEFFQRQNDWEEAIYHWLAARAFEEGAAAIEAAGENALRAGRLDTLATWIDALPAGVLVQHPLLQAYLGDVYRLRSRFDDALRWYSAAERTWRARGDAKGISRALRGQALIYLDTVRPAQAEGLLEEALRLSDGIADRAARARLLELMAENKLNMGKPEEAEALRAEAQALREEGPSEDGLTVRVKLRTGRLAEAQRILESWVASEREHAEHGQIHPPRSHRETVLLLSLIHALCGQAEQAFAFAQEGIALGERLQSPFVSAVGHIRLGHAWQLRPRLPLPRAGEGRGGGDESIRCYQTAIALGDRLAVRRTRVEAMWGLTRAYGFSGDLASAERAAAEGVEIGRWAGDPWIVALVELMLGASTVLAARPAEAIDILSRVLIAFRECGDRFGRAATRLWLSLAYLDLQPGERFAASVEDLLALCEAHGYEFLFTTPTLLGPPDTRRLVPMLIEARNRRCHAAYAARLLNEMGLPEIQVHRGYQLRVQTLGAFRVWRGADEVDPREWQRDKARHLFQLLLIERGRWLQRDEIVERLWPNLTPDAANRDFKVALNALNKALEPARPADAALAFVEREGTAYRLPPSADVWLDIIAFERECKDGLRLSDAGASDEAIAHLQAALHLYKGDFLPDALYEDWSNVERERLLSLYLRVADRLAGLLIERGQYEAGLDVCQAILARDPCWEGAYRLMMVAHARRGNPLLALRVYQRCVNTLHEQLGVEPSAATVAVYQRISRADPG